jgi:hypothetical protein
MLSSGRLIYFVLSNFILQSVVDGLRTGIIRPVFYRDLDF